MTFTLAEIEQAFISSLMQWPEPTMAVVGDFKITESFFHETSNRVLFERLKTYWAKGKPIELVSFTNDLRSLKILENLGGAHYITKTWCNTCYSPQIASYYAEMLQAANARREVVRSCRELVEEATLPVAEPKALIHETIERLNTIPTEVRRHRTLLEAVTEKMERMEKGEPPEDLILTGLTKIDENSPLRRGDMPLIVGQRKSGKSILALTIALNVARRGTPVCIFSLEDREPKIIDRLVSGLSRLSRHDLGKLNDSDHARAVEAITTLAKLPIHIKDDVLDLDSIGSVLRDLKARCQLGLAIVDYGQLVRVPITRKDTNREQVVAEISRTLRLLAMELDLPIIVLSQLNEAGQTRESRSLEQDATACWEIKMGDEEEEKFNIRYVSIPWQRNGPSGIHFKVTFFGEIARVENHQP